MADTRWQGMIEIDDAFLEKIYAKVAKIPYGRVTTYGKIAELAGFPKAYREAGIAMSRAPGGAGLPCHRVINKSGILSPDYAFGGPDKQKNLLQSEGITFLPSGAVHVEKHMWPDEGTGAQLSLFDM